MALWFAKWHMKYVSSPVLYPKIQDRCNLFINIEYFLLKHKINKEIFLKKKKKEDILELSNGNGVLI